MPFDTSLFRSYNLLLTIAFIPIKKTKKKFVCEFSKVVLYVYTILLALLKESNCTFIYKQHLLRFLVQFRHKAIFVYLCFLQALSISRSLFWAKSAAQKGQINCKELRELVIKEINGAGGRIDYVEVKTFSFFFLFNYVVCLDQLEMTHAFFNFSKQIR